MSTVQVSMAWVGPLCIKSIGSKNCRIRSTSGRTETARSRGKFSLTLRSLEDALPVKYPSAKWPIANVQESLVNTSEMSKGLIN